MALSMACSSLPNFVRFYPPIPNSFPSLSISIPPPPLPALTSKSLPILPQWALPRGPVLAKASPFTVSDITEEDDTIDDFDEEEDIRDDDFDEEEEASDYEFDEEEEASDYEYDEEEEEELDGSPWEGAVVYRRDASVSHLEYCTTLERLGLWKISSEVSQSRAAAMGIRLPVRRAKDSDFDDDETPVLISVDVTRKRRKLKLDGIVRTVIAVDCIRCARPAAECVFSNFTLLLTEDPIKEEELDEIDMEPTVEQLKSYKSYSEHENLNDAEDEIDLDDQLYFPAEQREIDLSKFIRDIIHVEITLTAVCDASCKGICLRCGTNLNKSSCKCSEGDDEDTSKGYGPFKDLLKQMQKT